jgi:hypothetical protein
MMLLGYDWLEEYSPMNCHLVNHNMEFLEKGKTIKLQGIHPTPLVLNVATAENFVKWHKGNDI